jgi:ketosteroid isomerase-like protein
MAVIFGLALVGVGTSALSAPSQDDAHVLKANEEAWAKAAVDGDADRMASFMTDDYLELEWEPAAKGVPGRWSTVRKDEWVGRVRSRQDVYTSVEVHNLTVHVQGTLAVVTGEYSQKGTSNGKDISAAGTYANTWVRRGNRWLVIHSVFP